MKKYHKEFVDIFKDTSYELIDLFNYLKVKPSELNKKVPDSVKRRLLSKISNWKKNGIVKGYFDYLIKNTKKYTYANVLMLMTYGIYFEKRNQIVNISKNIFQIVAKDSYNRGYTDLFKKSPFSYEILTWAYISKFLNVLNSNMNFEEYMNYLAQISAQESYTKLLQFIRQESDIKLKDLKKTIQKQKNRILNVNDDKYSGVLDTLSIQLGNEIYINVSPKNEKCMFIAEIDDKTTPMCLSLNGQIFNTRDKNTFIRYSDELKRNREYTIDGLVEGINMPPIIDHFHYCRSTLTFNF